MFIVWLVFSIEYLTISHVCFAYKHVYKVVVRIEFNIIAKHTFYYIYSVKFGIMKMIGF